MPVAESPRGGPGGLRREGSGPADGPAQILIHNLFRFIYLGRIYGLMVRLGISGAQRAHEAAEAPLFASSIVTHGRDVPNKAFSCHAQ